MANRAANRVASQVANRAANLTVMANAKEMTAQITTLALAFLERLIFTKSNIKMELEASGMKEALKLKKRLWAAWLADCFPKSMAVPVLNGWLI